MRTTNGKTKHQQIKLSNKVTAKNKGHVISFSVLPGVNHLYCLFHWQQTDKMTNSQSNFPSFFSQFPKSVCNKIQKHKNNTNLLRLSPTLNIISKLCKIQRDYHFQCQILRFDWYVDNIHFFAKKILDIECSDMIQVISLFLFNENTKQ